MKLGISSYTYPWSVGVGDEIPAVRLTPFDLLARAQALNVRVLQLADGLDLHTLSHSTLDAILHKAQVMDIALEVGTRATNKEDLLAYIAIAQCLRSPFLRVVMRTTDCLLSAAESVSLINNVLPELERANVILAIETHESVTAKQLRGIIEATSTKWVGVCFDTANSLGCFETAEVVWAELKDYVVNFHAKDVTVNRYGRGLGFIIAGSPAGQGKLDLAGLINAARALPRKVNVILEHWVPAEQTLEETMHKEQRWAVESIAYLRRLIAD